MNHPHAHHEGHTDCSEVLLRIYEYLDGELEAADVARIATHLAECQPCLAQHDLDTAVREVVRRACVEPPAPVALRLSIMTQITTFRVERDF